MRTRGTITLLAVAWIALAPPAARADEPVTAESPGETFVNANVAFREGRFADAAAGYERLLAAGERGHLRYNLGTARYRAGETGRAILEYERARRLIPRDADLRFNLDYVRGKLLDEPAGETSWVETLFFWNAALAPGELFWVFAALGALLWAAAALRLFVRVPWAQHLLVLLLLLWVPAGASLAAKLAVDLRDARLVVTAPEIAVRSGPDDGETVLFVLHEGSTVRRERTEGDWCLIRFSKERRGWAPRAQFDGVSP